MELSNIIRAAWSAVKVILKKTTPLLAERAAGKAPETVQSVDKTIIQNTLQRLAATKPDDSHTKSMLNSILHKIITPEYLDNPNVKNWLNNQSALIDLEQAVRLRSLGTPMPEELLSRLQTGYEKIALSGAQEAQGVVMGLIAILAESTIARVEDSGTASLTSAAYRELSSEVKDFRNKWENRTYSPQTIEVSEVITTGLEKNIAWLSEAFGSSKRARSVFGQALSPGDESVSYTIDREQLRIQVTDNILSANEDIICLLGGDGNGKSWIFAQAWMRCPNRPLTVIVVPDDINGSPCLEYCQSLLISKLLTQTKGIETIESKEQWLRVLQHWHSEPKPNTPRIVFFLDGINQRENIDWVQFIDTMSEVLAQLGGKLVFSCRQTFYKDRIRTRLPSRVITIEIPEWTIAELEKLLKEHGTSLTALDPDVVRSLRNPRIFGIAIKLFNSQQIAEFNELSINRLLFEHIRSGAVESNIISDVQFKTDICNHAESIVLRLKNEQLSDVYEFEMNSLAGKNGTERSISEQFVITSAGRFFEVTEENPNKYILKDEGLPLALGLTLVRTAREAYRKNKNVEDALSNILDPIAALDRTSNVLMGAILTAVLEELPSEITSTLIRSFVMLQNLDPSHYPEFRALFGVDPEAFLMALEGSTISNDTVSNLSWLTDAANDLRDNDHFEEALSCSVHRWLNMYSLSPDRMIMTPNTPEHAVEHGQRWSERKQQLDESIEALSEVEKSLLNNMNLTNHGDYSRLSLLAFQALAGRSLASYAISLRNWCFANSINGGFRSHHDVFDDLMHFNLVDWAATKDKLQEAAKIFKSDCTSRTGRWALVYILRTTGDSDDAHAANEIAETLTKDRPRFDGWRLLEDYCATDPCDPSSEEPYNIDTTVANYLAIAPSEIGRTRSHTRDDHFFTMAQPALARFRPDSAVKVLRAVADHVLTRELPEFRLAVNILRSNTVGLDRQIAKPYTEKGKEIAQAAMNSGKDENLEAWVAAQHALLVAFPHFSGDEQFAALLSHPKDKTVIWDLCWLLQPIESCVLERALTDAIREQNEVAQFRILFFAEHSLTLLNPQIKTLILSLLTSDHYHVRLSTLSLIQSIADPILLTGFLNSGWSALDLNPVEEKMEIFHGTQALVRALELRLLTFDEFLRRAPTSACDTLPEHLGAEAVSVISQHLNSAILKAIKFQVPENLPNIEKNIEGRYPPVLLSVSERISIDQGSDSHLDRISETSDAWYRRQKQHRDEAIYFEKNIADADAQLIVKSIKVGLISAIDDANPALVDSWHQTFLNLNNESLRNVHNVALLIAEVVSKREPLAGLRLFARLKTNSSHVRLTYARVKIDADAITCWRASDSEEIKKLCFARLDSMSNDYELSMEILAAIRTNRQNLIRDYVMDRRQRAEPAHRARAVMVAGLSPDEDWATSTIEMLKEESGFLHHAYKAAKYAMERHQWSRHWASQMRHAENPIDLWRFTILLSKVVDGRFASSDLTEGMASPLLKRFGPTLDDQIHNRIRKWKNKRQSKLFGMNAPAKSFITGYHDLS